MSPTIDSIGYAAAMLTTFAFIPQVVKSWRSRSTGDLSSTMLVVFTAGIVLWLLYGIGTDSMLGQSHPLCEHRLKQFRLIIRCAQQ